MCLVHVANVLFDVAYCPTCIDALVFRAFVMLVVRRILFRVPA